MVWYTVSMKAMGKLLSKSFVLAVVIAHPRLTYFLVVGMNGIFIFHTNEHFKCRNPDGTNKMGSDNNNNKIAWRFFAAITNIDIIEK